MANPTLPPTGPGGDTLVKINAKTLANGANVQDVELVTATEGGTSVAIGPGNPLATNDANSVASLGATADAAWVSGSGSVISVLKGIFGKLVSTPGAQVDGHSTTIGTTTDAAASSTGTVIAQLRRIANLLAGSLNVPAEQIHLAAGATVTAGTTAIDLIAANTLGRERIVVNLDSSITIFVGPTGVTPTNGVPILPSQRVTLNCNNLLRVITSVGTASVYVAETTV